MLGLKRRGRRKLFQRVIVDARRQLETLRAGLPNDRDTQLPVFLAAGAVLAGGLMAESLISDVKPLGRMWERDDNEKARRLTARMGVVLLANQGLSSESHTLTALPMLAQTLGDEEATALRIFDEFRAQREIDHPGELANLMLFHAIAGVLGADLPERPSHAKHPSRPESPGNLLDLYARYDSLGVNIRDVVSDGADQLALDLALVDELVASTYALRRSLEEDVVARAIRE